MKILKCLSFLLMLSACAQFPNNRSGNTLNSAQLSFLQQDSIKQLLKILPPARTTLRLINQPNQTWVNALHKSAYAVILAENSPNPMDKDSVDLEVQITELNPEIWALILKINHQSLSRTYTIEANNLPKSQQEWLFKDTNDA